MWNAGNGKGVRKKECSKIKSLHKEFITNVKLNEQVYLKKKDVLKERKVI